MEKEQKSQSEQYNYFNNKKLKQNRDSGPITKYLAYRVPKWERKKKHRSVFRNINQNLPKFDKRQIHTFNHLSKPKQDKPKVKHITRVKMVKTT